MLYCIMRKVNTTYKKIPVNVPWIEKSEEEE